MGNTFSRKADSTDKIFKIEDEIIKYEKKKLELNKGVKIRYYIIPSVIFPSFWAFFYHINDSEVIYSVLPTVFCIFLWIYCLKGLHSYRLSRLSKKMDYLKETQKNLIKEYKKHSSYSLARGLIDKYDDEESRQTFFNHIEKKKRESIEKLTDFVLGNDPTKMNALICNKCGVHNGLIDPGNNTFSYFYCFNCNEKNHRK